VTWWTVVPLVLLFSLWGWQIRRLQRRVDVLEGLVIKLGAAAKLLSDVQEQERRRREWERL